MSDLDLVRIVTERHPLKGERTRRASLADLIAVLKSEGAEELPASHGFLWEIAGNQDETRTFGPGRYLVFRLPEEASASSEPVSTSLAHGPIGGGE